ncbi:MULTISPECIES: outer membrane lipoprotein chaperone LolA [Deefgea]|uniref:Outer-membrane lipoprotein carrier protein n=1 Tax=Deefgea chitinilytica TaxID=570276 RepID=A0ABS2C7V5_9NEIS|nr:MULTISPECIES: outer membrane lipoprotein chaperone LolA [Deefgea]MBM5570238.1 outer membrane lipoprotein chaperone LolA [Deefgea chitinilytica]MBM9887467.1 outer membrane lipoprotein chaperone LolA [Deefgea sp. CFH1-16]
MSKFTHHFLSIFASMLLTSPTVFASNVAKLQQQLSETKTLQANFTQQVSGKNNKIQSSAGQVSLVRPGKFRWVYSKPYPQEIVSDGKQVWLYDIDLAQVTIKPVGKALDASPAAVLAGNNKLDTSFNTAELPNKDGLYWVELTPKQKESSFARIRIGFNENTLSRMELDDQFGQTTQIQFTQLIRNKAIEDKVFTFTPPAGTDIIRE